MTRGSLLMLIGAVIGLVSALGLAWDARVCADVLLDVMTARSMNPIATLGSRLVWAGRCPLGIAVGGTLVWFGLRRAAVEQGLSRSCVGLVALYGILAACGAFFVWQGTGNLHAVFKVIAGSEAAVKASELAGVTTESVGPLTRGWWLLAIAEVALLAAGVAQCVPGPKTPMRSDQWPLSPAVALTLLWLFALIVSTGWILYGRGFQQLAVAQELKASVVVAQIQGVVLSGFLGSFVLLGHAVLTMTIAGLATFPASKPDEGEAA